jgi:transposase InsO family protein
VRRISRDNRWWSVFGKKRGKSGKRPGSPAHDDLMRRDFTAAAPNELWLTDITEHPTTEGKIYLCAIKDVYSNRIVGYSISERMSPGSRSTPSLRRSPVAAATSPDASSTATGAVSSVPGSCWRNCGATT